MPADVGGDDGSLTDPRVAADAHRDEDSGLFSDRHVEPFDTVLLRAVHHRDVRRQQDVVFEFDISQRAIRADVNSVADPRGRMRQDRAERQTAIRPAAIPIVIAINT